MSAILKFDLQKRKQLRFSEVNYLNYTKRPNFAYGNYIFPKTRGNKNKPWTHSTPLNMIVYLIPSTTANNTHLYYLSTCVLSTDKFKRYALVLANSHGELEALMTMKVPGVLELGTDVRPEVSNTNLYNGISKPGKTRFCSPCVNHLFLEGPIFQSISTFYRVNYQSKNSSKIFAKSWPPKLGATYM